MDSMMDSATNAGSSSSGSGLVTAHQTVGKLTGPPYRKRPRNAVLSDPTLEQFMGSREKALDVEEFPEDSPIHLDDQDQGHWTRIRKALFDQEKVDQATKNTNPRSFGSHLAHARQTLRMLQDVSAGTREKFEISGCTPKKASKGLKATTTKSKTNGIAKAKRAKSTKARDRWPSQNETNLAMSSSSTAAQEDDATDGMDLTPTDAVLDSVEEMDFETPEQRMENDQAMRQMAIEIREEHPALRDITPDTMTRIAHFVDMGVWFPD